MHWAPHVAGILSTNQQFLEKGRQVHRVQTRVGRIWIKQGSGPSGRGFLTNDSDDLLSFPHAPLHDRGASFPKIAVFAQPLELLWVRVLLVDLHAEWLLARFPPRCFHMSHATR